MAAIQFKLFKINKKIVTVISIHIYIQSLAGPLGSAPLVRRRGNRAGCCRHHDSDRGHHVCSQEKKVMFVYYFYMHNCLFTCIEVILYFKFSLYYLYHIYFVLKRGLQVTCRVYPYT